MRGMQMPKPRSPALHLAPAPRTLWAMHTRAWSLLVVSCASILVWGCGAEGGVDDSGEEDALQSGDADLYGGTAPVEIALEAPLRTLFAAPEAGPALVGKLTLKPSGKVFDVEVNYRGESSAMSGTYGCPFKKLKVRFTGDKALRAGTPFQGHGSFRVNNACTFANDDVAYGGGLGRASGQIGPIREHASYRLVKALGAPVYQTRLGRVSYTDTSAATTDAGPDAGVLQPLAAEGRTFSRYAMFLESGGDALTRLAKTGAIDSEAAGAKNLSSSENEGQGISRARISRSNDVLVDWAQNMLGNADWRYVHHNIDVFGTPGEVGTKPQVALVVDLDLACTVASSDYASRSGIRCGNFFYRTKASGQERATDIPILEAMIAREPAVRAELEKIEQQGFAASPAYFARGTAGHAKDERFEIMHKTIDGAFATAKAKLQALRALPVAPDSGVADGSAPDAGARDGSIPRG